MDMTRRTLIAGAFALSGLSLVDPRPARAALTAFRPKGGGGINHSAFDALLQRHVKPDPQGYNRVDYRAFKASQSGLKVYLEALQAADPTSLSRNEAHAYWINLYNAKTLDVVLDAYPVSSIKKIALGGGGLFGTGPWSARLMTVNGVALSLDDVEHEIVRALFGDPMSHYGLNCASYSCPNLAVRAYTGDTVDALLAESGAAYINHPRGVSIVGGRITASKIYSWYAGDFGGKSQLKEHWAAFATPEKAAAIATASISGYDYDWSLNDI